MWSWSSISFVIYHRNLIPIYSLSLTIDNLVCGSICGSSSPWISFCCLILFPRNPCGSRCLPCPFWKCFWFLSKFTLMEDKPFHLGILCHCEKCIEFGLFVWTLLFLGVLYLIPSYIFYLLEWDKSLSMCGFMHPLCSIVFSSFGELCWINHALICYFGSRACMFTKCIYYTILCFVWSII